MFDINLKISWLTFEVNPLFDSMVKIKDMSTVKMEKGKNKGKKEEEWEFKD